jgi:hypothetical protein
LKKGAFIWSLVLAGIFQAPLWAQEPQVVPSQANTYAALAIRDAEYEHNLVFSNSVDEADYWHDQRVFEQKLLKRSPSFYMRYLQGKKNSYSEHRESCDSHCAHGDYYYRQASFYLQYDSGDEGGFLTLIQSENAGEWKVSVVDMKHY